MNNYLTYFCVVCGRNDFDQNEFFDHIKVCKMPEIINNQITMKFEVMIPANILPSKEELAEMSFKNYEEYLGKLYENEGMFWDGALTFVGIKK